MTVFFHFVNLFSQLFQAIKQTHLQRPISWCVEKMSKNTE